MNESEVFYTFSTAAEYGGGFYSLLGKAGLKADPSNKAKLLLAFPELKQTQVNPVQSILKPLNYSRLINMTEEQTKEAIKKAEIKKAEVKVLPNLVKKGKLDWATAESDSEGDEEEEDYYPVIKQQVNQVKQDLSAW